MKEFQKTIDFIKRQLNVNDLMSQKKASAILLKTLFESKEKQFFKELIDSNVLMDIIQIVNSENQGYILGCLELLTTRSSFFESYSVDQIITCLNKCDLMKSKEEATTAVKILHTSVNKIFEFDNSQGISFVQQHADEIWNFITQPTFDFSSLLTTTKFLNLLIRYSERSFKQTHFPAIRDIYSSAVEYLIKIEVDSVLERMKVVCCVSSSFIYLCSEIDEINSEDVRTIFDKIKAIAVEEVIPLLINSKIEIESADDFIDFLECVIDLNYKESEFCFNLTRNSFLQYLIELSVFGYERSFFRKKVCRVIFKIIMALKEIFQLPIDESPGCSINFQNYFCTGLESLPINSNDWEKILEIPDQKSNSLLVLVYCHFIATKEKYIFTKESLAIRLCFERKCPEPIFLKSLWLLYSVSSPVSEVSNLTIKPKLFSKATIRLLNMLQTQGSIELYYTHHRDLFLYSIREFEIPEGLRNKVIRLWLDKSNHDEEFDVFVKEFLHRGYDELKIVELLMGLNHANCMVNLDNTVRAYEALLKYRDVIPAEVVEFVLKTLAEDLAYYTPSNSKILKNVLGFASTLPISEYLPPSIVRKCAMGIGKVVMREDTDVILKTQLITAAAFVIRQSVELNDYKVADIFLKNDEFLKEIYDNGFFLKKPIMREVCLRSLTSLIFCQQKFNLQCKSVSQVTFKDLENVLISLEEESYSQELGVQLINLLILGNRNDNSLISLNKMEKNRDLKHIFNVYFLIHKIYSTSACDEEDETYQCLTTMLHYCSDRKLNMNIFLICAGTPTLVKISLKRIYESKKPSFAFLDFAMTWLRYRQAFRRAHRKLTKMIIKPTDEKSATLFIEFRANVTKMENATSDVVQDFCLVVDNYLRY